MHFGDRPVVPVHRCPRISPRFRQNATWARWFHQRSWSRCRADYSFRSPWLGRARLDSLPAAECGSARAGAMLGAARSRSEMTHEEALPGGAFEIRNRDMRAGIDVHGFLGRAEGIEERDAALARRHGVLPLKDELKRNGNRLGGILEGGLPGAQARKSEHGAFDARFAGDEWYADRRSHGNAPISDAFVPADERESLDRIEGGLPFRHGLLGSFRHGLQHVGGEACAGLAAHARADLRRELG